MEFETQKEYIQKKMYAKGINIETQDYSIYESKIIWRYIKC